MRRSCWKRLLCCLCALLLVVLAGGVPVAADLGDAFSEKFVIFDGGEQGKQVNWSSGNYVIWSTSGFDLTIPEDAIPEEKIGLYIHITLDAAAAAALNGGGSIELAYETCDRSEINCNTTVFQWKEGENEAIIPIMAIGGYTDGGGERFDISHVISWFRFYTTPGATNLTKDASAWIHEVSIVDSTAAGMAFGADDTYLTLQQPLSATPNTIEASIQTATLSSSWTIGTYSAVRYAENVLSNVTGTTNGVKGIPDGTPYVGGVVKKGGYFGTKDMTFSLSVPKAYGKDDLALTFWLYTSTGEVTKSYIELTSSGKCDVEELCWTTKDEEFSDLKVGWNRIVLPLSSRNGDGFDVHGINFSRIWGSSAAQDVATEEYEIYVTEMKLEIYSGDAPTAGKVEMIDGLPTWQVLDFSKMPNNWDGGKISVGNRWEHDGSAAAQPADGTIYMEVTPGSTLTFANDHAVYPGEAYWKAGFTAGVGNGFLAPEIPAVYSLKDLVFTFWIYIPDADLVPDDISADSPNFEFTSDGDVDGAEIDYLYMWEKIGGLQDGWNYVEIPMSEMDAESSFDLHAINFFRWTYMCSLKKSAGSSIRECVRYADFRIRSTVDRSGEEVAGGEAPTLSSEDTYMIFSNVGTQDPAIALYLNATGYVCWLWGENSYTSEFCAFTGEWIDLALVRDMAQGVFLLYADGEVVYTADASDTEDISPSVPHAIAADGQGRGVFDGVLTDIRVWSDVRTAEEIRSCRAPKVGQDHNGLAADEQGLLGAWFLIGSSNDILNRVEDSSQHGNDAVFAGSRPSDWIIDYAVPTDVIGENYFTLVVIPDTQELVTGRFTEEWLAAAQWIADNVEQENILHVIGAGDNTWTDEARQWEIARAGFDLFSDKVSWSNMTGNHDYPGSCLPVNDPTHTRRDSTNYQKYFGMDYIESTAGITHFVDYFDDPFGVSTTENAYYRMTVNGISWMILQLEYQPRVHVIEWANEILAAYPDDNVILTTHSYITDDTADFCTQWMPYTKEDSEIGGYLGELQGEVWPNGTTQPIWDELIRDNPNVKLLLCGHASTSDGHILTKWTRNAAGVEVPQVMINAQDLDVSYFESYAMSMLGLLRFRADGKQVEIQYYSPFHDATYQPSCEEMLSLSLDVTGECSVEVQYPTQNVPQSPTDTPPTENPPAEVPVNDPKTNATTLIIVIAVGVAVVGVGLGAVVVVAARKKAR